MLQIVQRRRANVVTTILKNQGGTISWRWDQLFGWENGTQTVNGMTQKQAEAIKTALLKKEFSQRHRLGKLLQ